MTIQIFLDAVLEGKADIKADFERWVGRRPWAQEWLELEAAASKVGIQLGFTRGAPMDVHQCTVCGVRDRRRSMGVCGSCKRQWVCQDCLAWIESIRLCPLCKADDDYVRNQYTTQPLKTKPLADALSKL